MERGEFINGVFSCLATSMIKRLKTDNKLDAKIVADGIWLDEVAYRKDRKVCWYMWIDVDGQDYGSAVDFRIPFCMEFGIDKTKAEQEATLMSTAWKDIVSRKAWDEVEPPTKKWMDFCEVTNGI